MANRYFVTVDANSNKYVQAELDVALQADIVAINNSISNNASNVYTKTQVDGFLATKADVTTVNAIDGRLTTAESEIDALQSTVGALDSTYAKLSDITSVYKVMGSVATKNALLSVSTPPKTGHVYNVIDTDMNYVYVGTEPSNTLADWDALGSSTTGVALESWVNQQLANYYTKTAADAEFIKTITASNATGIATAIKTGNNVDINFSGLASKLTALENSIGAIETNIGNIEDDIEDIQIEIAAMDERIDNLTGGSVASAKVNGVNIAKTGSTLEFGVKVNNTDVVVDFGGIVKISTCAVNTSATTMTKATLNATYATETVGFMLYCTNSALMTKYVKLDNNEWSVEPIFLAI